jgi:glycosyltransferase involved in cell wall biosynthesis
MADPLRLSADQFIVVEGMVDLEDLPVPQSPAVEPRSNLFTVAYTGGVSRRYGLTDLVDSMRHIPEPEVRLVICGDGDARNYVEHAAADDHRIMFMGSVSRAESLIWQSRADVLINPRSPAAAFTRLSFPSKNLEYLAAGKPVLAYWNAGTPHEYDNHLLYVEERGSEGIAASIRAVMGMTATERADVGARSRDFVRREKTASHQMARVLTFVGYMP